MEATTLRPDDVRRAAFQAFLLLRVGFTVAPILFGLDINDIVPGSGQDFMYVVGAVEIAAGILVAVAPRLGAPVVAAWLAGIVVNLLTANPPEYYDIALRDFGLMLGALTLTRLAWAFPRTRTVRETRGERVPMRRQVA
jgi:uncharacterized membrane protein YccC